MFRERWVPHGHEGTLLQVGKLTETIRDRPPRFILESSQHRPHKVLSSGSLVPLPARNTLGEVKSLARLYIFAVSKHGGERLGTRTDVGEVGQ